VQGEALPSIILMAGPRTKEYVGLTRQGLARRQVILREENTKVHAKLQTVGKKQWQYLFLQAYQLSLS
jgi:hypothetical protein